MSSELLNELQQLTREQEAASSEELDLFENVKTDSETSDKTLPNYLLAVCHVCIT